MTLSARPRARRRERRDAWSSGSVFVMCACACVRERLRDVDRWETRSRDDCGCGMRRELRDRDAGRLETDTARTLSALSLTATRDVPCHETCARENVVICDRRSSKPLLCTTDSVQSLQYCEDVCGQTFETRSFPCRITDVARRRGIYKNKLERCVSSKMQIQAASKALVDLGCASRAVRR